MILASEVTEGVTRVIAVWGFHPTTLKQWVDERMVKCIIVDEIHTILGEGFRSANEHLPSLASLRVLVATMSGTIPGPLLPSIIKYLGLSKDADQGGDIDVVEVKDCIGTFPSTFKFAVIEQQRAINYDISAMKSLSTEQLNHGIHVMVGGIKTGDVIMEALGKFTTC
jgi:hypothetical protein